MDLSLPSIHLVSVPPSVLAAGALLVSRSVWLPEEPASWSPGLAYYSGHSQEALGPTVRLLAKMLLRAPVSKYQVSTGWGWGVFCLSPITRSAWGRVGVGRGALSHVPKYQVRLD